MQTLEPSCPGGGNALEREEKEGVIPRSVHGRHYFCVSRINHWRRQWHPTPVLLPGKSHGRRSLVRLQTMGSQRVRHDWATSLSLFTFHFHALEKEMATHSSVLAWRIPGKGEPGGPPSMGSHRVGHDWSDLAAAAYLRSVHFTENKLYISEKN